MKSLQWLRRSGWVLSALGGLIAGVAQAGTYYEEQGQLIRASKSVKALGPDLFGDKVNHYNGALEFVQTDVNLLGGNELAVAVGRRFNANLTAFNLNGHFGRWDLEIPRIQGVFASGGFVNGWGGTDRCSRFSAPPTVTGNLQEGAWKAKEYWRGNMLYIPGSGEKEILLRTQDGWTGPTDGQAYGLLTKDNWSLGCIPLAQGGGEGEGFVALSPTGVRYQFDWMTGRTAAALYRATPFSSTQAAGRRQALAADRKPMRPDGYSLNRVEVWILPTKITDRYGNWVKFTYDAGDRGRLLRIDASDGRQLSFTYQDTPRRIKTVSDGVRTWTYNYTADGDLSGIVLPDQSRWTFSLDQFFMSSEEMYLGAPSTCLASGNGFLNKVRSAAVMTHPSGAVGRFEVEPVEHARGSDDATCFTLNGGVTMPASPAYYAIQSIQKKVLSGPGMPSQTWNYSYSSPIGEGSYPGCTYCPTTKWTQVQEPSGRFTRLTHGMKVGQNEGLLLKTEDYSAQGNLMRTVSQSYRAYDAGPYPQRVGSSILNFGDGYLHGRLQPLEQRVTTQQGQNFSWTVASGATGFDRWARTLQVLKSGPGGSRTETTVYKDLPDRWVMGLTESVSIAGFGASVFNEYDTLGRKTSETAFGVPTFTYGYNADGTLAWKQDGRGNRTRFDNYKLGLPQLVSYADGSTESATVNDLGLVTSHRSAANYTTGYGYDAMGRLNLITPPSGFTATSLVLEQVGSDEYGVPAGHWRQTVTKGNAKTVIVLDALWRPVMSRSFDASQEAATRKVVVKGFDLEGHPSFESYPARDYSSVAITSPGKRMSYDALGRLTLTEQDSELGVLQTRQDYTAGFSTTITNPRGKVTTQRFWALDNPAEASLSQVDMPEGVQLLIQRNLLGKTTAITRSGSAASVTRSYVYDGGQRLCKTIEPEVGATIQDYDAAGNVAWRAPGQTLTSTSSCDRAAATAGAKISYAYDAVNQLTGTSYGDGSPAIARTYWDDGKPKSVTAAGTAWNYSYNALRQLETEVLSFGGKTFSFSRSYNLAGDLAGLVYPSSNGTAGPVLSFNPNALGEPTAVSGYASNVSFHPNAAVAGYTLANGVVHSLTQNVRGLPSENSDSGILKDVYAYDANGNVTGITDQQESLFSRSMGYDGLDRLTSANAPGVWGSASYTYDGVDNLRTATVGSRSATLNYTDGSNRLNSITVNGSTSSYSYDAYGNITSKGGQTFTFDLGNRLSASSLGGQYVYDGLGRRVQVVTKAGETRLQVYSQEGQLLWSTAPGGPVPATIVGYSCPPGTTLSGTSCLGSVVVAATPTYSCAPGYTLSGSTCSKSVTESKAANQTLVCPGGMTLQAGQCVGSASEPATQQWYCPDSSWTLSGSTCSRTTTSTQAASETQSCTRGTLVGGQCQVPDSKPGVPIYACPDSSWTLSGSSCSKTVPDDYAASISGYSCPNGGTPSGSSCVVSSSAPATPIYDCAGLGTPKPYNSSQACMDYGVPAYSSSEATQACNDEYSSYGMTLLGVKFKSGKLWSCIYQPRVTGYTCASGTLQGSQCVSTSSTAGTPSYSCPSGGTLDGTMCRRTKVATQPATVSGYTCPSNYTLSGSTCNGYVYEAPVKRYSCPDSGWTLSGTTCSKPVVESQAAASRYTCRSGWTLSGQTCSTSTTQAPTTQYSCDSGWTLSGSSCSRTTTSTVAATVSGYTCDAGYTLQADNTCKSSSSSPATPKYGCPDGSSSTAGGTCPGSVQGTAYIYLGGKLIAETVVGGATQYVHTDALGSPVARTGPTRALISRTRYEPYGYVAAGTKPSASTSQIGFTGHVQDAETELVYMQQRYYDPIAGRFLSIDPVTTEADTGKEFGRYTYVDNNPYAKVDPDGALSEAFWASPNRIVVTIPYRITQNRNATLGFTRAAFERQVARDFSGSVQVGDRTIQMEVRAEERTTGRANEIQVVESTAGVTQSGREETRGGLMGNPVNTIVIDSATSVDVASHEMGHAGGAGDQYRGGLSRNHQTLAADVPGPANRMRNNGPARANRQTRNELAERHVKKETD